VDPSVAVWWLERQHGKWTERVLACDVWQDINQNTRALHLTIEALCGIERWGCTEIVEKAFTGFAALPAAGETFTKRGWREVLANGLEWPSELAADELLVIVKARHRKLAALHHPDRGGSTEEAATINAALAEAEHELGGHP
jgi:hypothetical protein